MTDRRGHLWPETKQAIDEVGGSTRIAKVHQYENGQFSSEFPFRNLMVLARVRQRGRGLRGLRHTFGHVTGLHSTDQGARLCVMGHSKGAMAIANYDSRFPSDERLRAVAAVVRQWLF